MPHQIPTANLARDLRTMKESIARLERPANLLWRNGVYQGSWSVIGALGPRYRVAGNALFLGGRAQGGANGQNIVLLVDPADPNPPPAPTYQQFFAVATSGGTAQISVASGYVRMEAGFSSWVSLDGVTVWLD